MVKLLLSFSPLAHFFFDWDSNPFRPLSAIKQNFHINEREKGLRSQSAKQKFQQLRALCLSFVFLGNKKFYLLFISIISNLLKSQAQFVLRSLLTRAIGCAI